MSDGPGPAFPRKMLLREYVFAKAHDRKHYGRAAMRSLMYKFWTLLASDQECGEIDNLMEIICAKGSGERNMTNAT